MKRILVFLSCFCLLACGEKSSGPGGAETEKKMVTPCEAKLDLSSATSAAISGARAQKACGQSEEEFVSYYGLE